MDAYPSQNPENNHLLTSLSPEAAQIVAAEQLAERHIEIDSSLRIKILDQCGMACTFCHNEGTPVSSDNKGRDSSEFVSSGKSNRVSIYLGTNNVDFVSGTVQPDEEFSHALTDLDAAVPYDEVHLTGGEPTLHPGLADVVNMLSDRGLIVKITSNGERFYKVADQLKEAGLSKVVFSIFGTTPEELAEIQGNKFRNPKLAALKLRALEQSIEAANRVGISASANIVMPASSHAPRVKRVIEAFGDICKIRILNSLDEGEESYAAIYELLAELGAVPTGVNINAGASGMSVDYVLPDGKEVSFKQIRNSYLEEVCSSCALRENGCEEGFYGTRMYVDQNNEYRVGVCIQRMDLTRRLGEFVASGLPDAIIRHREDDYAALTQMDHNE